MKILRSIAALFLLATVVAVLEGQEATSSNPTAQAQNQQRVQKAVASIEKAISVLIPGGVPEGSPRKQGLSNVIELFGRGKIPDAMASLKKMSVDDPELPPAEIIMAGISFAVGDNAAGISFLENGAILHPDYPGVYLSFAQLAINAGRVTDASLHADKTARILESTNLLPSQQSHFLKQYYEVATSVYLRRKQDNLANGTLEKLQEVSPNLPFYFVSKARLAFRAGQNDVALQLLKRHASSINSDKLPELTLVEWLKTGGQPEPAEKLLLETVAANPDDSLGQMMAAQMYMSREEFSKALVAIRNFEKASGAETNRSIDMKGRIAFAGLSYGLAATHFANLLSKAPNDASNANIYALSLIESDKPEERTQALRMSEQVARRMSNNPLAFASLGYIYLKSGQIEKANGILARVALTRQTTPEISYFISHWLNETGQSEKAIEILKQAIDTPGLFLYRSASRKLLADIQAKQ